MDNKETFLFDRRKYTVLIAGLIMLAVGFGLMLGGGSENPAEFNPEIFGTQRVGITLVPIHRFDFTDCGHHDA